jgi:toxin ParE1/3/4
MPGHPIRFHPEAVAEVRTAFQWYAQRSETAAERLMEELDLAVQRIASDPVRWPVYLMGTKRYFLHRFPYIVVYRIRDPVVEVVAVAHAKRRPGYWKSR